MYQPPPLHSSRRENIARVRKQHQAEPTTFHMILGLFVLAAMGALWLIGAVAAVLLSALFVYGLWDFGHFLLGG